MKLNSVVLCLFATSLSLLGSTTTADDWTCFRGADRSGRTTETGLKKSWPENGPKKVWVSKDAGIGYSNFAVVCDRMYTMGADASTEYVIALDAKTGRKVWQTPVGQRLQNGWGDGPRSTPAVSGDTVVAIGGKGALVCVAAADGKKLWSVELTELGGKIPTWGYSESPLIDGDTVLATPGGKQGTVARFNLADGAKLWQSADIKEFCHYSSIVPIEHYGQKQYLQLTMSKVFGLDNDGKLLWQADWPGRTAVIPTPIYNAGQVFVTAGYGSGCMLLNVTKDNQVEKVYANKKMKNHHGGVILIGDALYGYSDGVGWACLDWATGDIVWNEKKALGKGAISYADGRFYCLDEKSGTCVLIEATRDSWKKVGEFRLDPQTQQRATKGKVWTHPVIANGKLYLRDQEVVICYDIAG
ncbi:MAG: PQQ-binding-like beta-propeller repeat protein [Fuerstiella sp.]